MRNSTKAIMVAVIALGTAFLAAGCSHTSKSASAELKAAAAEIGFHPEIGPGIGEVEGLPANMAPETAGQTLLPVGAVAPPFRLKTATGTVVNLRSLRGKAVLIDFFATWCPHCQAESPHLDQIAQGLPPARYAVVAINADGEEAPSVYAYDTYYRLSYPSLLDPSDTPGSFHHRGTPGTVTRAYGVAFLPTFYIIAPDGTVAWRADREQPDARIRAELEKAAGK